MLGLCDDHGRPVRLGGKIGDGGEGTVYHLADRHGFCAKIFDTTKAASRADKLRAMLAAPANSTNLAWPQQCLYQGGAFVGYCMPAIPNAREAYHFLQGTERMLFGAWITWFDLHEVAAGVIRAVGEVHRAGHCVGDLNPRNILISLAAPAATIIDTDSFQIARGPGLPPLRCPGAFEGFLAPELVGQDLNLVDRTPHSDSFALGVLVYRLLMNGADPFDGTLKNDSELARDERLRRGLAAVAGHERKFRAQAATIPNDVLHPALRACFSDCFAQGAKRPDRRPSAQTWLAAVREAQASLTVCSNNQKHYFGSRSRRCPWCNYSATNGIDLFPANHGWQHAASEELVRALGAVKASAPVRLRLFHSFVHGRLDDGRLTDAERAFLRTAGGVLGLDLRTINAEIAGQVQALGAVDESTARAAGPVQLSSPPPPMVMSAPTLRPAARSLPYPAKTHRPRRGTRRTLRNLLLAAGALGLFAYGKSCATSWLPEHAAALSELAVVPVPRPPATPSVLTTLRAYYTDLNAGTFEASRYFAPKVSQYILMRSTTPQQIDKYMRSDFPKQYKQYHYVMDEASLRASGPRQFDYTAMDSYFQVARGKHRRFSVNIRVRFDASNRITDFEELSHLELN
jgi:serine/threonine protein kinase